MAEMRTFSSFRRASHSRRVPAPIRSTPTKSQTRACVSRRITLLLVGLPFVLERRNDVPCYRDGALEGAKERLWLVVNRNQTRHRFASLRDGDGLSGGRYLIHQLEAFRLEFRRFQGLGHGLLLWSRLWSCQERDGKIARGRRVAQTPPVV